MRLATLILAAAALSAAGCAQEPNRGAVTAQNRAPKRGVRTQAQEQDKEGASDHSPRRLESVTWNSVKHQLTWDISKGEKQGASYKALGSDHYEISMDSATMTYNGEARRFSRQEATNVHMLMDLISKYAIDSTVWWDNGQGEPVDGNGNPKPDNRKDKKNNNEDNATTVHVSFVHPLLAAPGPATDATDIHTRILIMERQLATLKQLERALESLSLNRL